MTELLDLFDDPVPAPPAAPVAAKAPAPAPPVPASAKACVRLFDGVHRCRVGGGDAHYSDNFGRTWFCTDHRPVGFLPRDRGQAGGKP